MKKAVYQNPKSQKYYTMVDRDGAERPDLVTVFDNAKVLEKAEIKVDKKGRAYRVVDVEWHTTKNGFQVLGTVAPEK